MRIMKRFSKNHPNLKNLEILCLCLVSLANIKVLFIIFIKRNVVYYMHRIVEVYLVDIIMSLIPNVPIQLKKLLSIIYLR
ncbi:hypothetical protein RhiirA1_181901 [Rhizophagus irregularis]|uniref:Uncharacterized protein n=1 Tax=Rhizophagus irregularis TaxID=588596 RepID=A0A2N0SGC8_9GLOM|nr:hypothetical protein RhiirA1_181901 [Rhizophagus irregularis]